MLSAIIFPAFPEVMGACSYLKYFWCSYYIANYCYPSGIFVFFKQDPAILLLLGSEFRYCWFGDPNCLWNEFAEGLGDDGKI